MPRFHNSGGPLALFFCQGWTPVSYLNCMQDGGNFRRTRRAAASWLLLYLLGWFCSGMHLATRQHSYCAASGAPIHGHCEHSVAHATEGEGESAGLDSAQFSAESQVEHEDVCVWLLHLRAELPLAGNPIHSAGCLCIAVAVRWVRLAPPAPTLPVWLLAPKHSPPIA